MSSWPAEILSMPLVQRVGWALVHSVWQGAVVALLLVIVLAFLRRRSAQVRWAASCVAMALMVLLPLLTALLVPTDVPVTERTGLGAPGGPAIAIGPDAPVVATVPDAVPVDSALPTLKSPRGPVDEAVVVHQASETKSPVARRTWSAWVASHVEAQLPWVVFAWLVGVTGMSVWHIGGWWQAERGKRRDTRPAGPQVERALEKLADRLGLTRAVGVLESAHVAVPVVVGWLRPVILLPAHALTGLTPDQLRAVLAHELAHVKRHDCLVRACQVVVETLLFYHPATWWVSARIRQESEYCCDEMALTVCGDRHGYARALAMVAERGRQPRGSLAATGGKLLDRI